MTDTSKQKILRPIPLSGHIILGEIANVIASMRQNIKFNTRAKMAGSGLIQNLERLRQKVESIPDRGIFKLEPLEYMQPFLDVIKSEETSGPITAVALTAVHKFINCQFLVPTSKNAAKGIRVVVTSVLHCKFEATDSAMDEVVLMKILNVLLVCLSIPAGQLLTNKVIYEMIQTCFKMSIQTKLTILLRKSAEMTLLEMVQCIFSRFYAMQEDQLTIATTTTTTTSTTTSTTHMTMSITPTKMDEFSSGNAIEDVHTDYDYNNIDNNNTNDNNTDNNNSNDNNNDNKNDNTNNNNNDKDVNPAQADDNKTTTQEVTENDKNKSAESNNTNNENSDENAPTTNAISKTGNSDDENHNLKSHQIDIHSFASEIGDSEATDIQPKVLGDVSEDKGPDDSKKIEQKNLDTQEALQEQQQELETEKGPETPNIIAMSPSITPINTPLVHRKIDNTNDSTNTDLPRITRESSDITRESRDITRDLPDVTKESQDMPRESLDVPRESFSAKRTSNDMLSDEDSDTEKKYVNTQGVTFQKWNDNEEKKPASTRVLIKLLSFFCSLVNPSDNKKSPSMRLLGLNLLNTIIEFQGPAIGQIPQLLGFVCNDLCKYLLQALQKIKRDESAILNLILRILFNLVISLGQHLKFQIEIFFLFCSKLISDEHTTPDQQELILDTITQLLREHSFAVDLFVNFDCSLVNENLLENLVEYFYKTLVHREEKSSNNPVRENSVYLHTTSLNVFTSMLQMIHGRLQSQDYTPFIPGLSPDALFEQKQLKSTLSTAAEYFKVKPQQAYEFMQEKKLLPTPLDEESVAKFLRNNFFLNKAKVGEYLGSNKDFNVKVLAAYARSFDFRGKPFLTSLREFFQSFRPLGEAQVIERYITHFTVAFLADHEFMLTEDFPVTKDAFEILSYSVFILNVDQHSPHLGGDRPRMTQAQYVSNLRGLNNEKDFSKQLLIDIYEDVKADEIKIHREHLEQGLADITWKHLYNDSHTFNEDYLNIYDTNLKCNNFCEFYGTSTSVRNYDPMIFHHIWRKILAANKFVYNTTKDPDILGKTLANFQMSADISAYYKMYHAFDTVVITLCELSTITPANVHTNSAKTFAVNFGRNERAHHVTTELFHIIQKHGDHLREGWRNVLAALIRLSALEFLPNLVTFKDIFTFPEENQPPPQQHGSTTFGQFALGFFSGTSSWFLSSGTDDSNVETTMEKKYKQVTQNVIKKCKLPEFVTCSTKLEAESLVYWIRVLAGGAGSAGNGANGHTDGNSSSAHDTAGAKLCLNLLAEIALLNKSRIELIWPYIADYIEATCSLHTKFEHLYDLVTIVFVLAYNLIPSTSSVISAPTNLSSTTTNSTATTVATTTSTTPIKILILRSLLVPTRLQLTNSFYHNKLRRKISIGISKVLLANISNMKAQEEWEVAIELIRWTFKSPITLKDGFEVLQFSILGGTTYQPIVRQSTQPLSPLLLSQQHQIQSTTLITRENFSQHMDLLSLSLSSLTKQSNDYIPIASKSLELLQYVVTVVPNFFHSFDVSAGSADQTEEKEALQLYWIPTLQYLCSVCRESRAEIQSHAIATLQRALLAPQLFLLSAKSWITILEKVLFPLLHDLLKISPTSTDKVSKDFVEEIRLRAASILCKTFLQYLSKIISYSEFTSLWIKILKVIEMYMKADESELLAEAVTEALKNILMVMHASGILRPPSTATVGAQISTFEDDENERVRKDALWEVTWNAIDQFCPKLKQDLSAITGFTPKTGSVNISETSQPATTNTPNTATSTQKPTKKN